MHNKYRNNKKIRTAALFARLANLGLSVSEADTLRLAEKTLHRWHELECGDSNEYASWGIERDETTGKPYMVRHAYPSRYSPKGLTSRYRIADRETGALKRVNAVIGAHPGLWYYQQGDPRGCAIYVGTMSDIPDGASLDSCYTRGVAVCVD